MVISLAGLASPKKAGRSADQVLRALSPTLGAMFRILRISGLRVDPNGRHLKLQVRLKLGVGRQRLRNAEVDPLLPMDCGSRAIKAA